MAQALILCFFFNILVAPTIREITILKVVNDSEDASDDEKGFNSMASN